MKKIVSCVITLFLVLCTVSAELDVPTKKNFYLRGALYQDWMGLKYQGEDSFYSRLGSRLKLTFWNKPGTGWTAYVDVRNRAALGEGGGNRFTLYDARLGFDGPNSKLFFSLGQMNLYDTAGIGELTGGLVGYKLTPSLNLGAYAGFEPDLYYSPLDFDTQKFGVFLRYAGRGARQLSLSFNHLVFDGQTERQFVYAGLLLPVRDIVLLYGNLEYETAGNIKNEDRLSRLFVNSRLNLAKYLHVTAHYSSGRGLDYHRFLLEQSQNPTVANIEGIERYYYNRLYGVRFGIVPTRDIRLYLAVRRSRQEDRDIENKTLRFGLSLGDILKSGISLTAHYNANRGDRSESDSYYISLSRYFGKLSWQFSFANYYNGVRFSAAAVPEIFYYPDRQTFSTGFFWALNRSLALALDYAFSYENDGGGNEHQFFIRVILRK